MKTSQNDESSPVLNLSLPYTHASLPCVITDSISIVGYSNTDTIPEKCGLESFIVFVHTPAELYDTVYPVIEKINLKFFNPNRYKHIM